MDLPPIIVNLAQFVAPFVGELARLNAQGVTINSVLKKNENKIIDKKNALSDKYGIIGVSFTFLEGTVLKSIRKFLKTLADDVDKAASLLEKLDNVAEALKLDGVTIDGIKNAIKTISADVDKLESLLVQLKTDLKTDLKTISKKSTKIVTDIKNALIPISNGLKSLASRLKPLAAAVTNIQLNSLSADLDKFITAFDKLDIFVSKLDLGASEPTVSISTATATATATDASTEKLFSKAQIETFFTEVTNIIKEFSYLPYYETTANQNVINIFDEALKTLISQVYYASDNAEDNLLILLLIIYVLGYWIVRVSFTIAANPDNVFLPFYNQRNLALYDNLILPLIADYFYRNDAYEGTTPNTTDFAFANITKIISKITSNANPAVAIASILDIILKNRRQLPIINSITNIKTKIQENPEIPSEVKSNLQVDLTSLETEINKLYNLYNTISSTTASGLPYQLVLLINTLRDNETEIQQELQKRLVQNIQSQIQLRQQIRQEERFLPLLTLIATTVIDIFKQ